MKTAFHRRALLAFVVALCGGLGAQSVVHPTHHTAAEGLTGNVQPLGSGTTPARVLQIHDGLPAGSIRGMALRLDSTHTAAVAGFSAFVEVHMSTAVTTPGAPNANFDANHGADRTVVLPPRVVQFPSVEHGVLPKPFTHALTFTTPFNYTASGPLCWEIRITSRSTTASFSLDQATANGNPAPVATNFGTGCAVSGNTQRMTLNGSGFANWSAGTMQFSYLGSSLPRSSVVFLNFGVSTTSFSGLPLPFELPGSASAPSGACTVYHDIVSQLPVFTSASGSLVSGTNLAITVGPALHGANLFSQVMALDSSANAFGVVTSNAVQHHIVAPLPTGSVGVGMVDRTGSSLPTGTVAANRGAIVRFDY
ncbi:MAG: hypothetical protein AB7T19_15965 [Planctomycetota bacterium]